MCSELDRAPLIAIEGMDGCGKSTATRLLIDLLHERGVHAATYDFPIYEESQFGPLLSRFLRGGFEGIGSAEPWFVAMLFAGNRAEMSSRIRGDLTSGRLVVCDRYSYSNIAFQSSKLPPNEDASAFTSWLMHLEFETFQNPQPDVSFWLRVPPDLRPAGSVRRDRGYLNGAVDIHEANEDLQLRVHHAYEDLAFRKGDIQTIDCAPRGRLLPPTDIAQTLISQLESLELIPKWTSPIEIKR